MEQALAICDIFIALSSGVGSSESEESGIAIEIFNVCPKIIAL